MLFRRWISLKGCSVLTEKWSLKESLPLAYGSDHGPTTVATILPEFLNFAIACLLA
jgi:hypothetical protein